VYYVLCWLFIHVWIVRLKCTMYAALQHQCKYFFRLILRWIKHNIQCIEYTFLHYLWEITMLCSLSSVWLCGRSCTLSREATPSVLLITHVSVIYLKLLRWMSVRDADVVGWSTRNWMNGCMDIVNCRTVIYRQMLDVSCPSDLTPWKLGHMSNSIWWRVHIVNLYIMQLSPASC
jgi:hypothetical protein